MSELDPSPGDADLAWCRDAVEDVSRTFALTVDTLEDPMATRICLGYLLCRIPDTVEDAGHIPPADQAALLRAYGRGLDPARDATVEGFVDAAEPWIPQPDERTAERSDDWRVVASAPRVGATFDRLPGEVRRAITPPVLEMVEGMATFVERHADEGGIRVGTRAELDEYCHYAAGTVGTLVTNLLTLGAVEPARRDVLRETAESFARLLQLVNVATDVHDDYTAEDNVYLPATWLAEADVPQERVLAPEHRESAADVVSRTERYAASHLDDAQRYLEAMPLADGDATDRTANAEWDGDADADADADGTARAGGNTLAAWAVPYLLAVGTLRELSAAPANALTEGGVKVSREEVFAVVEATRRADRDALGDLRAAVANGPLHEASSPVSPI